MSILFLISSLTSSILSGYVLSQLLSLLTRSCVIKYNTGTYQHTYTGCDAERYRWRCRCDGDGDCQLKLDCPVSDTVTLTFIIILQVRESASSQRSQE